MFKNILWLALLLVFYSNISSAGVILEGAKKYLGIADDIVSLGQGVLDFVEKKNITGSLQYKNDDIYLSDRNVESELSVEQKNLSVDLQKTAWINAEKGNHLDALRMYRQALEINANNAGAWHGYGWSFSQLGLFNEAHNAFSMSLKLRGSSKKSSETWRHLGWNYERQNMLQDAKKCYIEALFADGANKSAQYAFDHLGSGVVPKNKTASFALQAGAFDDEHKAKELLGKVKLTYSDARIKNLSGKYCVLVGNYKTKQEVKDAKNRLSYTNESAKDFYPKAI